MSRYSVASSFAHASSSTNSTSFSLPVAELRASQAANICGNHPRGRRISGALSDGFNPHFELLLLCRSSLCGLGAFAQSVSLVRLFPCEVRIAAAEVPVGSGLLEDGAAQVQRLDDGLGRQREVLADQLLRYSRSPCRCRRSPPARSPARPRRWRRPAGPQRGSARPAATMFLAM